MLVAAFLALLSVDTLALAYLIRHDLIRRAGGSGGQPIGWFDPDRFRRSPGAGNVVERIYTARGVIIHPCFYGGDPIEYPLLADFPEDAVLATLAEIEAL